MIERAQCYGGPFDGAEVAIPVFEFVHTDGRRNFRDPGPGRVLYRKARTTAHTYVLLYAQPNYTRCDRCDAYHSRSTETCSLCGAPLSTAIR